MATRWIMCCCTAFPGLGKTTLSAIIAHEMGVNLRVTTGPAIEKAGDLAAILTNLQPNDVLFIDEIHRLNRQVEEILYPALEDHAIDIIMGKGPSARSLRVDLNPFTLVGATTRAGQLSSPLRARFGVILRLELYTTEQLTDIVRRSAMLLKIPCSIDGATEIAGRARGTPRIANRLLKRVRDFADVMGDGEITQDIAHMALDRLEIDELGLDSNDRRMLEMIIKGYGGVPCGTGNTGIGAGGGNRNAGRCLRAVPDAAWLFGTHPKGTLCHSAGISASGIRHAQFRRRCRGTDDALGRRRMRARVHRHLSTSFRQILLHTA